MSKMAPGRHGRLAPVSLVLLAAVLLIVDISLGVHCKSVFVNVFSTPQLITCMLYQKIVKNVCHNFQESKLMSSNILCCPTKTSNTKDIQLTLI